MNQGTDGWAQYLDVAIDARMAHDFGIDSVVASAQNGKFLLPTERRRENASHHFLAQMHHHDKIRICFGLITNVIIRNDVGRAKLLIERSAQLPPLVFQMQSRASLAVSE